MKLSLTRSSRTYVIVLSAAIILVLATYNLASWLFLRQIRGSLESELDRRIQAVARLGAELAQTDEFVRFYRLNPGYANSAELTATLERLADENDVQQILLIDHAWQVVVSSNEIIAPPGNVAIHLLDDSLAVHNAWQGKVTSSEIYETAGSQFKTAYAPVRDYADRIVMLYVVEASADFFSLVATYERGVIIGSIASFVVLIVFAVFLAGAMTLFLRTQEHLRRSERLASMGQMAATVAHEIRNPLSIIKNTAEVLRQKYERAAEPDELFEFIPSEVRRLSRLVNDFLSFARDRELNRQPGNLAATVERAVDMVRKEEQSRDLDWQVQMPAEAIMAEYDDDAILQVLINLLLNATQAMSGAGTIAVTLETVKRKQRENHIIIRDQGPGLPEPLEKLLEPFYTTKTFGSGLGLAVANQFVIKHGGKLTAESEHGKGTAMHIWLPV